MALGPRIGKFNRNGTVNAIPGHNVPMVAVGTLILAFGWFGFNAGRVLDVADLRIGSIADLHHAGDLGGLPDLDGDDVGEVRQARPDHGLQRPARRRGGDLGVVRASSTRSAPWPSGRSPGCWWSGASCSSRRR